jgi:hypothetical protein
LEKHSNGGKIINGVHLPSQVIETTPTILGAGSLRSDSEQPQVMIVGGAFSTKECCAGKGVDNFKPKRAGIERHGSVDVANVEHCMIESLNACHEVARSFEHVSGKVEG